MKNADLNGVSGFIEEAELESIAAGETYGGGTPLAGVVVGIAAITLTAGACPTSACTKSCWKPW